MAPQNHCFFPHLGKYRKTNWQTSLKNHFLVNAEKAMSLRLRIFLVINDLSALSSSICESVSPGNATTQSITTDVTAINRSDQCNLIILNMDQKKVTSSSCSPKIKMTWIMERERGWRALGAHWNQPGLWEELMAIFRDCPQELLPSPSHQAFHTDKKEKKKFLYFIWTTVLRETKTTPRKCKSFSGNRFLLPNVNKLWQCSSFSFK